MSCTTRNEVLELAKSKLDDLVQLTSDLIKIPSENPIGTQRDVVDFVKNISLRQVLLVKKWAVTRSILVLWRKSARKRDSV